MEECAAHKCQSCVCLQMNQLQSPMGCHGHHAILCDPKRFIFGYNKDLWYLVVPINNFAFMCNCPLVQSKSNKPPPPPNSRGVCGGEEGGANSYSMILPLYLVSEIHEYANEIILYMTIG